MTNGEVLDELEFIRLRVYRMRLRCKKSTWFVNILKAIESLIKSAIASVEHVAMATKN